MREDLKQIKGVRVGGEPADEAEHLYVCAACGQGVDKRDLAAVFHHEDLGHEPLPLEQAVRMVKSEALRAAVVEGRWRPGTKSWVS